MNNAKAGRGDPGARMASSRWILVIGVMLLGAVTARVEPTSPAPTHVGRGIEVYRANYCGACHALAAAGTAGTFGPSHDGMATIAAERLRDPAYSGAAATPAEYVRESILDPLVYLTPGYQHSTHAMPAFGHLNEDDLNALIDLLLAQ